MSTVATHTAKMQAPEAVEYNCINTTIHYFQRTTKTSHRSTINFFSVWVCGDGIIRKAPAKLKKYKDQPLAYLLKDYSKWEHHIIL